MQRALPGARQHLGAILASASVVVKALCAVVLFLYLLSFAVDTGCLAVTPGYLFPPNFWIWTLATHGLMEQHVWDVAISLATVVVAGRLLEPLWGALELLIFFSVVNVSVGLLGALAYLLTYMASFNLVYLFTIHNHNARYGVSEQQPVQIPICSKIVPQWYNSSPRKWLQGHWCHGSWASPYV
eukprot:XP_006257781.1 PREDICTED: transmembrane protein 115-like [Rattus norvegicus]